MKNTRGKGKEGNIRDYYLDEDILNDIEYFTNVCNKFYEENYHFPSDKVVELITNKTTKRIKRLYKDWQSFLKIEFNLQKDLKMTCSSYELRLSKEQKDWDYLGTSTDLTEEIENKFPIGIYVNRRCGLYYVTRHIDTYNNIPVSEYKIA